LEGAVGVIGPCIKHWWDWLREGYSEILDGHGELLSGTWNWYSTTLGEECYCVGHPRVSGL